MKKLILMTCLWGSLVPNFIWALEEKTDIPVLIPFNQVLFNEYCVHKAEEYEKASEYLTYICGVGLFTIVLGAYSLNQMSDKIGAEWNMWHKAQGIGSSAWCGSKLIGATAWTGYGVWSLIGTIGNFCIHTKALGSNDYEDKYKEWHALLCTTPDKQQRKWHEVIYNLFGKPTVQGIAQEGMPYSLQFNKNGLGEILFDPYNLESVKILLGIHSTIKDTCLCKEITIVI